MRRWNGWGEVTRDEPLSAQAVEFLHARIGAGATPLDQIEADALARIPASRVPNLPGFETDAVTRLLHARGQSLPDWLALRLGVPGGGIGPVADAVARPDSHAAAAATLDAALRAGARVVPYGGGTSVVGHLGVADDDRPTVNLSLQRMNRLLHIDERARLARFGGGTPGPQVEAQLAARGFLLGHFPQSYEYSTVGGWVVTRSSGQQSLRYGRIEQLFAGGRLATPRGEWHVGGHPASSAGPDLREFVLGSEGRLGVLTEATVRIRPLPQCEDFHAVFFPDWQAGIEGVRAMAQADLPLSMLRLSNAAETETQLTLAGHDKAIAWLRKYLRMRGSGAAPTLLLVGVTGSHRDARRMRHDALALARQQHGVHAGRLIGRGWAAKRFAGPYLRNSLWQAGYAVDTVETAVNWPQATAMMQAMEAAAGEALAVEQQRVHAITHLSHVYRQGCSLYSTFVFRAAPDYATNLERWRRLKRSVSQAIVALGGTISHQHGVGVDHAPYLAAEKGALGLDAIRAVARELDPQGLMNPGKLVDG